MKIEDKEQLRDLLEIYCDVKVERLRKIMFERIVDFIEKCSMSDVKIVFPAEETTQSLYGIMTPPGKDKFVWPTVPMMEPGVFAYACPFPDDNKTYTTTSSSTSIELPVKENDK